MALFLPANIRAGLENAPTAPSAVNPFITLADLAGGGGIYSGNGVVPSATVATVTDTLTFDDGTTVMSQSSGGDTITAGVGTSPTGFGVFGRAELLNIGGGQFDGWSAQYSGVQGPEITSQVYDNTTFIEVAGWYLAQDNFDGTDRPYGIGYYTSDGVNYTGLQWDVRGELLLTQFAGLVTTPIGAGTGPMYVDSTGYIKVATYADFAAQLPIAGGNGIYGGSDSLGGNTTADMATFTMTFNNGDFLVETVGAAAYMAAISDQVILGGSDDVWVDTGILQLGGPFSPGDPTIVFNDDASVFAGTLENTVLTADRVWTLPDATGTLLLGSGTTDYLARWNAGALTIGVTRDNGSSVGMGIAPNASRLIRARSAAGHTTTASIENFIGGAGATFAVVGLANSSDLPYGGSFEAGASSATGVSVGARFVGIGVATLPAGFTSIGGVGMAGPNTANAGDVAGLAAVVDDNNANDNYGLVINVVNGGAGAAYIGKFTDGTEAANRVLTSDANGVATWANPYNVAAAYTPTNVTTTRTFDADAPPTNAELADVLGTLIADLQSVNILS